MMRKGEITGYWEREKGNEGRREKRERGKEGGWRRTEVCTWYLM